MSGPKIRNMEEFAKKSGISRPTVSKFFNDSASVKPSTKARIEEALEKYDYRPNIYAINQNRRLTKTIGIVVPYLADPFFAEIARKIETRCIEAGFSPSLFSSHGKQALENDILSGLLSLKPAGVLLAPLGRTSDRSSVETFCSEVPTILFDSNIDGVGRAFIGSDNPQFTSQIVDYLCRSGEPPCFFEMKNPPNPNARKRRQGYMMAMEQQGQTPHIYEARGDGWALEAIGYREGLRMIDNGGFNTNTVLCSNDRLAIGLLAACYERNIRVGREESASMRVAGMDGHPLTPFTCPPLTTVAHDYDAISDRSVEALLNLIKGEESFDVRLETLFEGRLAMRRSA